MKPLVCLERSKHPVWKHDHLVEEVRKWIAVVWFTGKNSTENDRHQQVYARATQLLQDRTDEQEDLANFEYNNLYRFITYRIGAPRLSPALDGLALVLREFVETVGEQLRPLLAKSIRRSEFWNPFEKYLSDPSPLTEAEKSDDFAIPVDLESGLGIEPKSYLQASAIVTGVDTPVADSQADSFSTFYSSYRYSSTAGYVVRSQIRFRPAIDSDPVCRFYNRLKNVDGAVREVHGIVALIGETLYAIGQIRGAPGLKFMAFSKTTGEEPNKLYGLTLSKMQVPVAARILLVREEGPLDEDEIFTRSAAVDAALQSPEFEREIEPHIKNQCAFALKQAILFRRDEQQSTRKVEQQDMVTYVGELLHGKFELVHPARPDVRSEFNPADHKHYPFNQAIVIQDP